jgi:hypothetical protein
MESMGRFTYEDFGNIGVLPNRQLHIRARVSGANLCLDINC